MSIFDDFSRNDGTTIRAKRVIKTLNPHFNMVIVTLASKNVSASSHQKIIRAPINRQFIQLPFWWLGLFFILPRLQFDVIYCSSDWYGFLPCYLFSKIRGCPIVFEAHGILSEEYKELGRLGLSKLYCFWERFVITRSKAVIALSQNIFNFYATYNKNISLISVYVDTNKYEANFEKRRMLQLKYNLSGYKVVGLIGPFDTEWNKHSLDFVYANIDYFDKRIKFVIIGKCASAIKHHEHLVYTGYVEDYIGVLSSLDAVLVVPNVSTSGPLNKIIESMSCSLPVFTTVNGVVGIDFAENMKNLLICDEDELVEMINVCIFDYCLLQKISSNARETIKKFYDQTVNEKKLLQCCNQVL